MQKTAGNSPASTTTNSTTVTITQATTLVANAKPWTYTLTFNPNGWTVSQTTKSVTYGTTYTDLPTPTREWYDFKGWYATFNGSNYVKMWRGYMYTDKISVHVSAYMTDWSQYNGRVISCTESGWWNIEPSGWKIQFSAILPHCASPLFLRIGNKGRQ